MRLIITYLYVFCIIISKTKERNSGVLMLIG